MMVPSAQRSICLITLTIVLLMVYYAIAEGADDKFSLIPQVVVTTGDGKPAHDIPRIGLQGRHWSEPLNLYS